MIRDILTAGRAAVRSSAAASSAAQEASSAAAAAAANAKTALEEVEKFVNIFEGHKCDQWMSLETTKKNINGPTRIERKTLADESKDESAMAASSDPFIDCDQKAKTSDAKERVSVKEKMSQIFKLMFSRKETIVDGIEDYRTVDSLAIHKTELVSQNHEPEGFDSVDAASSVQQAPHSVSEAETSLIVIEEDSTSHKSIGNAEACQKGYSRDFLPSNPTHLRWRGRNQKTHHWCCQR